jgi:hypothetical protein
VFSLVAKYPNDLGETPADSIPSRRFTVEAFSGPTIYLSPRARAVARSQNYTIEVKALNFAGTEAEKLKGLHLVLSLPTGVTYAGIDTLDFLKQAGGSVLGWAAKTGNTLTIDLGRAGSPAASPADSGSVVRLRLQAGTSVSTDSIRVVACEARNASNVAVPGVVVRGFKIETR